MPSAAEVQISLKATTNITTTWQQREMNCSMSLHRLNSLLAVCSRVGDPWSTCCLLPGCPAQAQSRTWGSSSSTAMAESIPIKQIQLGMTFPGPGKYQRHASNLSASFLHGGAILSHHFSALPLHMSVKQLCLSWISLQSLYLLDLPKCAAAEMLVDRTGYRVEAAKM